MSSFWIGGICFLGGFLLCAVISWLILCAILKEFGKVWFRLWSFEMGSFSTGIFVGMGIMLVLIFVVLLQGLIAFLNHL